MDKKSLRELIIASSMYSIGSIIGPLLIFGGIGFVIDKFFDSSPWFLLASIFVAFITTNILLFKKVKKLNEMMLSQSPKKLETEELENKNKEVDSLNS